jgi:hypothetical protein
LVRGEGEGVDDVEGGRGGVGGGRGGEAGEGGRGSGEVKADIGVVEVKPVCDEVMLAVWVRGGVKLEDGDEEGEVSGFKERGEGEALNALRGEEGAEVSAAGGGRVRGEDRLLEGVDVAVR